MRDRRRVLRYFGAILLGIGCASAAQCADLPSAWRAWRYSRAVQTLDLNARTPAEIPLPWDLFARCQDYCRDVRLIDDRAQEIPFELFSESGASSWRSHSARMVENSFVAGAYTQVIADLGADPPIYDQVRVETPEPDFIVWAELAVSDDARTWRIVDPRAPISAFHSRAIDGTQTIPFQGLYARYIRVRIFQTASQFPVHGIQAIHGIARLARRDAIPATFASEASEEPGVSRWRVGLGAENIPVSEISFTTTEPEFYRAVQMSSSADGKEWRVHASGEIYRYEHAGKVRESLRIFFPEFLGRRFWRVEIINGNDRALAGVAIALRGVQRKLLFRAELGRTYRVLYGNSKAAAPRYDLSHFLNGDVLKPAHAVATLGPEELTANFDDQRPFSERHANLLWFALAVAVALLGYTAVRALRTPAAPPQSSLR